MDQKEIDDWKRKIEGFGASNREVKIIKGEDKLIQSLNHDWDLIKELSDQRFIIQGICD